MLFIDSGRSLLLSLSELTDGEFMIQLIISYKNYSYRKQLVDKCNKLCHVIWQSANCMDYCLLLPTFVTQKLDVLVFVNEQYSILISLPYFGHTVN